MRSVWFVLLGAVMAFSACEKIDLKRDNPLDKCKDCSNTDICIYCDDYYVDNGGYNNRVDVCLKNAGISDAEGVTAVFSTTSKYVSGLTSSKAYYCTIEAGTSMWSSCVSWCTYNTAFSFSLSPNAPLGAVVQIKIDIEDAKGNKWEDNLSLPVKNLNSW